MRKTLIAFCALLIGGAMIVNDVQAARVGGARSSGIQRSAPAAAPSGTPAKPAQQQAAPSGQQAAPAQPAPSGFAKWAPLLGGLAIGGMLGALFGSGGFGALGGILLFALLAVAVVLVVRAFMRRGAAGQSMQYAGLNERVSMPQASPMAPQASPMASQASPMVSQAAAVAVPVDFDAAAFLRNAKLNFIRLQASNDARNLDELREVATAEMFEELAKDVRGRVSPQHTDVMRLDAELVEVTTEGDKHWTSVRFSGLLREAAGAEPVEFQEVWNLVKPADGSTGWLLAGIQQTA